MEKRRRSSHPVRIDSERQSIPADVETGIATRLQESSSDGDADAQPQEQEEERATGQVSREAGHMDAKSQNHSRITNLFVRKQR